MDGRGKDCKGSWWLVVAIKTLLGMEIFCCEFKALEKRGCVVECGGVKWERRVDVAKHGRMCVGFC